jgi:hypothetical protein
LRHEQKTVTWDRLRPDSKCEFQATPLRCDATALTRLKTILN